MKEYISEWANADEIAKHLGGHNWVVARRSPRITAKYGEDVICVSPARYREMHKVILAARA